MVTASGALAKNTVGWINMIIRIALTNAEDLAIITISDTKPLDKLEMCDALLEYIEKLKGELNAGQDSSPIEAS